MLFPMDRKYRIEWRKFGLNPSVMLHLLSHTVPLLSESHCTLGHTAYTHEHTSSHMAHIGICTRTNKHPAVCYLQKYISFFRVFVKNIEYRIESQILLYAWRVQTLFLSLSLFFPLSRVCVFDTTESPASFICLFGVCCHKQNLHVDINSLWSLTELMNVNYASRYSASCRSGYTRTYACIWAHTHASKQTHTLGS